MFSTNLVLGCFFPDVFESSPPRPIYLRDAAESAMLSVLRQFSFGWIGVGL